MNTETGEERSCLCSLLSLLPKVKLPFGISKAIEEGKSQLLVFHLQTALRGSAKSSLLFRGFVEFPAYLNAIKVTKKHTAAAFPALEGFRDSPTRSAGGRARLFPLHPARENKKKKPQSPVTAFIFSRHEAGRRTPSLSKAPSGADLQLP